MNKTTTHFLIFLLSLFTTTHILIGESCLPDEYGNIYVTTWKDNGNNGNPIEVSQYNIPIIPKLVLYKAFTLHFQRIGGVGSRLPKHSTPIMSLE